MEIDASTESNQSQENNSEIIQKINKKEGKIAKFSKPNFVTKAIVNRPVLVILLFFALFIVSLVLTFVFDWVKQSENTDQHWLIREDEKVIRYDTYNEIQEIFKQSSQGQKVPLRSQDIEDWETYIMLECQEENCDNVLTVDSINMLINIEKEIKELDNYEKFCLGSPDNQENCSSYSLISITRVFTQAQINNGITEVDLQQNLSFITQETMFPNFKFLFGKEFQTQQNLKSKYLLSVLKFGAPLQINNTRYKSQFDNFENQQQEFEIFTQKVQKIIEKYNNNEGDNENQVNVLVFSQTIFYLVIDDVVARDTFFVIGSILFVWIYLTVHLQSVFLGVFSMISIVMSFPLSMVIFRTVLQVGYLGQVHIMIIFVVLGIAADDIFVFIDAWNQSQYIEGIRDDLQKRMAVTFKRASKAMLATSSTTSAAFLATGMSSVMPISSFGLFASILIPMNFFLVILFFPALLIFQKKYLENIKCMKKNKIQSKNIKKKENITEIQTQIVYVQPKTNNNNDNDNDNNGNDNNNDKDNDNNNNEKKKEISKIDSFFEKQFNSFIYRFRYITLILTFIWVSCAAYFASQIGPQTEPDKWLPESHDLQRILDHLQDDMHTSGKGGIRIKVNLFWGVQRLDKKGISKWDSENVGEIIWDNDFDLSKEENQVFLVKICEKLERETVVKDGDVVCFMQDFQNYIIQIERSQFPVKQGDFFKKLQQFVQTPQGQQHYLKNYIGIIEGELKYVAIELTSIGRPDQTYLELQEIEEQWQRLVSNINKQGPQGLKNGEFSSYNFAWMMSQKAFIDNVIQGLIISILFSFMVLLLATQNLLITIYSVLSIVFILVSVVSMMQLKGWEIGVAESITIVILNGFSVDYVVHLANHYVESSYFGRFQRIQESLREIGVSVLSGSITTFGSGLFLVFSQLAMFSKFSIIILTTIGFSVYFSLGFFATLMHVVGPQGGQGRICSRKRTRIQNNNNNDIEQEKKDGEKECSKSEKTEEEEQTLGRRQSQQSTEIGTAL